MSGGGQGRLLALRCWPVLWVLSWVGGVGLGGEGGQAGMGGDDLASPGPGWVDFEALASGGADQAAGDGEDAQPEAKLAPRTVQSGRKKGRATTGKGKLHLKAALAQMATGTPKTDTWQSPETVHGGCRCRP